MTPSQRRRTWRGNRKLARSFFIGGGVLVPMIVGIMFIKFGAIDALSIGLAVGVGSLVELMGVAMNVQAQRALKLFCEGQATIGKIVAVQAPADRQGNAYVFLDVAFTDHQGQNRKGKVTTIGNTKQLDAREGAEVAVLYLPNQTKFAVFTPGLGLTPGVLQS